MKRVYGWAGVRYIITKFSQMDSLPNFLTHGAPLKNCGCVIVQADEDGKRYHCKHSFSSPSQLREFKALLGKMATRPEEYITLDGRVTNNIPEGYHGIALMYRNKRIDLGSVHYKCKTNMSIPHKAINNNMVISLKHIIKWCN